MPNHTPGAYLDSQQGVVIQDVGINIQAQTHLPVPWHVLTQLLTALKKEQKSSATCE